MTSLEMQIETKAYVRLENWLMDYYMQNHTPAPQSLKEQRRKEIRREVIQEEINHVLGAIEEVLK